MESPITIRIKRAAGAGADLPLPIRMTAQSAGLDLPAAVAEPVTLAPGERKLIPCGFHMALPPGYEAQVRPRSGLASKHGVTLVNSPGTIDADYRGEVQVLLINHGSEPFVVTRGMRMAQLVMAQVARIDVQEVMELDGTTRGIAGFGSTGTGNP